MNLDAGGLSLKLHIYDCQKFRKRSSRLSLCLLFRKHLREREHTYPKYMCIRSDSGKEGEEETFCYYFGDLLVVRHPKEDKKGKKLAFTKIRRGGQARLVCSSVTSVPLHLLN